MADDIIFNITGDSQSAIDSAQAFLDILGQIDQAISGLAGSLDIFEEIASALDNVDSAGRAASTSIQALYLQAQEATDQLGLAAKNLDIVTSSISNINTDAAVAAIDQLYTSITDLSDVAVIALDDLNKLGAAGAQVASGLSPAVTANQDVAAAADKVTAAATNASAALDKQTASADAANASLQTQAAEEEIDAQDLDQVTVALDQADASAANLASSGADAESVLAELNATVAEVAATLQDLNVQLLTAASSAEDTALAFDAVQQSMAAQNAAMASTTTATSAATTEMVGFGNATRTAGEDAAYAGGLFGPDSMNLILMASAIGMAGGAFLQMGMDAQTAISHITGLADQSLTLASNSKTLDSYIGQLGQDAMQYGVSMADAANGLYYIISAGFKTSDALTVLKSSMEASAATGTQMNIVSNALTSILDAYGLSASHAAQVTDMMVQTVVAGKQDFSTFANAIGPVASAAEHAGISMNQMFAAEASLSQINPRIRQDAQNLANLFNTLSNNAQKIVDAADAMGGHLTLASFQAMPLMDKLQTLAKIAGGDTTTAFRKLLQNQTAATAAFNLLRDGGSSYNDILNQINHSQGALDTAFQQSSQDIQFGLNRITAALSYISYQFVAQIGPIVSPIINQIANAVSFVGAHFQQLEPIINGLAAFLGTVLVGAIVSLAGFMINLGGPIFAIATAIGLITAAIGFVVPKFQELQQWINTNVPAWSSFVNLLQQLRDVIQGGLTAALNILLGAFTNLALWLRQNLPPTISDIINNLVQLGEHILVEVTPAIQSLVNNTLIPFAKKVVSEVVPAIEKLVSEIMAMADYISGHIPQILDRAKDLFDKLATVVSIAAGAFAGLRIAIAISAAGGIAAFLSGVGARILTFFTTLIPQALQALGPLFAALGPALADPFTYVIIIFVALIAYFVYLSTQSKQLQDAWATLKGPLTDVWNAIKQAVSDVANAFKQDLWPALQDLGKALAPLMPLIKAMAIALGYGTIGLLGAVLELAAALIELAGKVIAGLITALGGLINFIKDTIKFFGDLLNAILGFFSKSGDQAQRWEKVWEDIKNILKDLWQVIAGIWQATLGGIIQATSDFIGRTTAFFENLSNTLVGHSIIPDMLNKMVQLFRNFPKQILQVIQQWVSDVIKFFQNLADQLVGHSIVPDMINKIVNLFKSLPQLVQQILQQWIQDVVKYFEDMAKSVEQAGQDMMQQFGKAIQQGFQTVEQFIEQACSTVIPKPLQELAQKAVQWGADFIKGFGQGIISGMQGVLFSVMGLASSISGYLHFSKPDVGPLADADTWGNDFGDLLASGINAQVNKVGNAAKNVAMSINGAMISPGSLNASITATNDPVVSVLREILMAIKQSQSGTPQGTIGSPFTGTQLGSVQQQFIMNMLGSTNANMMYSQLNSLLGLAYEQSNRGAVTGLGY